MEDISRTRQSLERHIAETLARCVRESSLAKRQGDAYPLAHARASLESVSAMERYGQFGDAELVRGTYYGVTTLRDTVAQLVAANLLSGAQVASLLDPLRTFDEAAEAPEIASDPGELHLPEDLVLVRDSFRRFGQSVIAPLAEKVHRQNTDIPEEILSGLGELGAFGLSIPEEFGGFATEPVDLMPMVVATEELSRASLGIGGSLITRPEILARALLAGGTQEQKLSYLPRLASGEIFAAVAVTEPDYGSDVAHLTTTASPADDVFVINGTKTWCTFAGRADVLMVLARSEQDRNLAHRGLSLFLVEKPPTPGHQFHHVQPGGGVLEGHAIDTLGYRGMHSYEVSFRDWEVPATSLIGGPAGRGQGFYLQMAGFENGRIQTAARAVGVMQAAYEAALNYASARSVFGKHLLEFELTQIKLARMATTVQAARQLCYEVATSMSHKRETLRASMAKAFSCRVAEHVTREAMQMHGGMGYAEEYAVSRYFVDARVLSIFEGADETLALRVIAPALSRELDPSVRETTTR